MSDKKVINNNSGIPVLWIGGWLFSIGFLNLGFWKAVAAIFIWPYYIGEFLYQVPK